jgi:hypothetical protein
LEVEMRNGKTTYRKGGGGEKERRGRRIEKMRESRKEEEIEFEKGKERR